MRLELNRLTYIVWPTVFVFDSGRHYLGFGWRQPVRGLSWYNVVHPNDAFSALRKHQSCEQSHTVLHSLYGRPQDF